jgi:hypothetical protein
MSHATPTAADPESDPIDHAALRLMLSYVEAECLRIGATDAARHAALAAALMPGSARAPAKEGPRRARPGLREVSAGRRPRGGSLH